MPTTAKMCPALCVVATAGLPLSTGSVCSASDEDFLYWAKGTFLIPIKQHWELGFEQKLGFGEEARRLDHQMQDYGVVYSDPGQWLKLYATLKVVHAKTDDREDWIQETRPHFNAGVFSGLFGLNMINRSRIEYRDIEGEVTTRRLRHKVLLVSPATLTSWKLQRFIGNELFYFYSFNSRRLSGQRLCTGFYIPVAEKVRLELFYFWYLCKDDDHWHDLNILGSYVRFKF